jgi:hypothetical protein
MMEQPVDDGQPFKKRNTTIKQKPRVTDKQPMIEKPHVHDEKVGGNTVPVSKPVNKKPNELLVLDYETGNLVPAKEKEGDNVDTDKQPMIEKPPVDDEQVVGNVASVSEQVNQITNEIQVLDYETRNLVPVKEIAYENVKQTVDGEPHVRPCAIDVEYPFGPVVAYVRIHGCQ